MRILLLVDDPHEQALLTQHLAIGDDDLEVVRHAVAERGQLPREFHAAGYDAVLIDDRPGGHDALDWIRDFRQRLLFPPIIHLIAATDVPRAEAAIAAGAYGSIVKRKIGNRAFVNLVRDAARLQNKVRTAFRASPEAQSAYRFGTTVIKGLRCVRPIAQSAMSTVYLAESEREGRIVVLKLLRQIPDLGDKPATFDRFLQEYDIIRRIDHPNVVRIYALGVADDHAFLQMEYFPAGDLRARLRRGFDTARAPRLLRQMAEALQAIHSAGVLHRDLKPGNVMLREDGSLALIDFGLAKQLALEAEITGSGEIFGTPYYMSPEQGHGRATDARSDLYSVGIMFYEMLTGRKPYLAATPMAVIWQHSHAPLPALPVEHARWAPIWERLAAKKPEDRYPNAAALLAAMDRLEEGF
jgi:tRNA A-37 threonylcarbamoyl transferase component Bud32